MSYLWWTASRVVRQRGGFADIVATVEQGGGLANVGIAGKMPSPAAELRRRLLPLPDAHRIACGRIGPAWP